MILVRRRFLAPLQERFNESSIECNTDREMEKTKMHFRDHHVTTPVNIGGMRQMLTSMNRF
jgi:hypothetical protein